MRQTTWKVPVGSCCNDAIGLDSVNEVSDSISVKPAKDGKCLSFFLAIKEDFDFFHAGATIKLLKTKWTVGSPENDLDEPEVDE